MERRKILKLAGGGAVLAAVGGALGSQPIFGVPPTAVTAWQGPAAESDVRRWVLAHALLAPNPHNMQPWLADLSAPEEIVLRLDTGRLLPATDPFGRQILMGAGAFLEILVMAAAERNHRAEIALFPEGEPDGTLDGRPFARVRLIADASAPRDPLFAQVFARRTDRQAYDPARPPAAADAGHLRAAAETLPVHFGLTGDAARVEAIRTIARRAWRIELTTENALMESLRVLRIGSREIDRHRDGIVITSPMLVIMAKTGLFDRSAFPAPDSQATVAQIARFDAVTASTPAYLWIVTDGNRRRQQIEAGRAYTRVNLAGAAMGLAMHPNEQALQEYKEVTEPYRAIHALLDATASGRTLQMLARVGYLPAGAMPAEPAPRRGLSALLGA